MKAITFYMEGKSQSSGQHLRYESCKCMKPLKSVVRTEVRTPLKVGSYLFYRAIQVDTYFLCKDTSVHGLITGWFQPVLNIISWSLFPTLKCLGMGLAIRNIRDVLILKVPLS